MHNVSVRTRLPLGHATTFAGDSDRGTTLRHVSALSLDPCSLDVDMSRLCRSRRQPPLQTPRIALDAPLPWHRIHALHSASSPFHPRSREDDTSSHDKTDAHHLSSTTTPLHDRRRCGEYTPRPTSPSLDLSQGLPQVRPFELISVALIY